MIQQFYPVGPHGYRYELNKDMDFSAAHFVPSPLADKCQNMHGHTYFVNITVVGDVLNESGFLVNFQELKHLVHDRYDHRVMNDVFPFAETEMPTTEVVARVIWERIQKYLDNDTINNPDCLQVIVRETPTSYVVFRPGQEDFSNVR